ncbi:DUF1611 domain-containing protein [Aquibacillus rhizosphaerae]|uniref:DUF1611 domain-containing protein n=1 Tax=Aquibacillus rhizosphaerae TaxID=3051431 RepID=A0ABT7L3P2_9BACI|nr:DUF1611 domain-containing protein [Aquibacillus sp. LR5S19]MDL4839795.1 DUF1611 domain-containing protein [Aquibacillus sp. LR5S19]
MKETALVYCESNFGSMDGKTANGLVRSSRKFEIVGVIDSTKAGMDAGVCLVGEKNGIPIFDSLGDALVNLTRVPDQFIYGIAPTEGFLKTEERSMLIHAMEQGINIINPLHEFFNDDAEFAICAKKNNVSILDVRKPAAKKDLHLFSGRILDIDTPIVAVLGTDSAIGKRTTSVLLEDALLEAGLNVAFIATGQTGIIQGAKYGVAIDAIPSQFMTGEIEHQILRAYDNDNPDIIVVEGQGALSHPAYISSVGIIRGARPGAIIVQHAPKRPRSGDFSYIEPTDVKSEINLIETFSKSKVIAITLNHENMTNEELTTTISEYEEDLKLPTTDALKFGCDKLVTSIFETFPELKSKQTKRIYK